MCSNLICQSTDYAVWSTNIPAAEGTSCGDRMVTALKDYFSLLVARNMLHLSIQSLLFFQRCSNGQCVYSYQ